MATYTSQRLREVISGFLIEALDTYVQEAKTTVTGGFGKYEDWPKDFAQTMMEA